RADLGIGHDRRLRRGGGRKREHEESTSEHVASVKRVDPPFRGGRHDAAARTAVSVPISRTPLVSGSSHTVAAASSANGTASAMPAPKVVRAATMLMITGARNCTPRATL